MELQNNRKEKQKGDSERIPFFHKILSVLLVLIVWQLVAMKINQKLLIVSPFAVFTRLLNIWKEQGFFESILFTFKHIAGGFFVGTFVGGVLAILAYKFRWIQVLVWPWMALIKSVPVASFIVICLVWLSASKISIFISFLIVVPIMYHNLLEALFHMDEKLREMAKVFEVSFVKRIRYIVLPQIAPAFLAACQVSIGMAWKAGVAAEIIGTPNGSIGRNLYLAKIYLDTDDLLTWTFVVVLISILFEKLVLFIIKRLLLGKEGEV